MHEDSSPGLFLGRREEIHTTSHESVIGGLNIIDLKRNRDKTANQGDGLRIVGIHSFKREVGFSSIELRPTHIGPGERDGHTQRFRIELKGSFPFDHVHPDCIELVVQVASHPT